MPDETFNVPAKSKCGFVGVIVNATAPGASVARFERKGRMLADMEEAWNSRDFLTRAAAKLPVVEHTHAP
ncbi:hypothetical protein CYMTET_28989 [Cymbomonas tetramitiformis]|uniref:Uncharacterized protein n=1 Tax=Cymbomonas tetramitiformis TaxID=36881 RepID=A0AAE0BL74_9CHLO|nr:hypothetical protein CYMTET_51937 [Cymbomonas tetramitiformis]KAK3262137.1 hypothetical protein CYMTET_28989 [Cymbomonas tetramitiformis]